jgi:hypothetical protein
VKRSGGRRRFASTTLAILVIVMAPGLYFLHFDRADR